MPDTVESIATRSESFERLIALAFEHEDAVAYREWSRLDGGARRAAAADPHVLLSVITHAALLVGRPEPVTPDGSEGYVGSVQALINGVADDLRGARREFQVEWFQGLERWVAATVEHLHFDVAAQALQLAFDTGAQRFPGLFQALRASEAELLARTGQTVKAAEIALWYAQRPYLLPERRRLPQIYPRLTATLLLTGRINEYRALLWRGLREAYMSPTLRDWFVEKIAKTYRGHLQALMRSGARQDDRAQLLLHLLLKPARQIALLQLLQVDRLSYWIAAAIGYALVRRASTALPPRSSKATPLNAILVTRAMGGIGDLLMMTPGLRALKRVHPDAEIHFAVPRQFFALFEGNEDFTCVDIESTTLDLARYRAWFDLTDCPASRIESRQAPNVRVGRIEAFARALGLPAGAVKGAAARPKYVIAPSERLAAERDSHALRRGGRPLVGLQWQSGESYRDYPHNLELLRLLTTRCDVALFGARNSHDPGIEGVHVISRPLREAFALAAQCDVLIGPDSAFLHLAAALDKPMVLLSGPVDGMLRSKPYPTVVPIVPDRSEFPCAPCWRNENINCYLSERRESVCLRSIEPATIAARVFSLLATPIPLLTMHIGPDAADAPPGAPTHSQPLKGERMARKIATPPAAAVQCKVCGSPVREVFRLPSSKQTGQPIPNSADDCPYYECRRCHFLFATLHDRIDHTTLYDETYWKTQDPDWYGRVSETLRLVLLSQSFLDIAPWWLRVLDFGCGMGTFVEVARRQLQMEVWGTDIIEPRFGREWFVRSGDIAAAQFDVIVACEVIEHLTDPVGLFDQIKSWLKRGGVFAFQTAYYDPGACGRDWWYIGPANGHVSLYSARSFDVLAERLGARRRVSWNNYPGLQAWQF